ncbi:MAG: hypothetical protein IJI68_13955 [Eggerthellaceae bacterium]|nr:hypothetical protein [Eggerthellaceae bacterium]
MEEKTEIKISFRNENDAAAAFPYVEGAVTCFYLYKDGFFSDSEEAVRNDPFQLYVMNFNEIIRDYDKDKLLSEHPDCAHQYLSQDGADIVLKQCADIQGPVPDLQLKDREGFFSYLCFLLALIFPLKTYRAVCRHTEADSDFVQETLAEYDAIAIHFEQPQEELEGERQGELGNSVTADWIIAPECVSNK